jgi:glycerate 2-kinase
VAVVRVLVAPDSFKGTFDAPAVAEALARGFEAAGWEADRCPVADGGEGTMALLAEALGARVEQATVSDPLGRQVRASFAIGGAARVGAVEDPRPGETASVEEAQAPRVGAVEVPPAETAIVEMAQASGLALVAEDERDAWAASTRGTGELVLAAVGAGAREILVAVGGSATTDGGRGAIEAIRAGGGLRGARIVVLCDVETAFEDAARVFAPQKGADPAMVARLQARLAQLATDLPCDPRGVPATGAAGGLSGGLWAAFDAELRPGAPAVLDALRVDERMRAAQLVVAGEGCLDEQSLRGKVVGELARRARAAGVPVHAVVGTSCLTQAEATRAGLAGVSIATTLEEIEAAARALAAAAARAT